MRFARRAKWLTHLFTPSVTPPTSFPDSYGPDVSLTAPYDGGGWGIPEPGEFGRSAASAVGAAITTVIVTVGPNEIFRLLAAAVNHSAGAAANVALFVTPLGASQVIFCSNRMISDSTMQAFSFFPPILSPGMTLSGNHLGDASTLTNWRVYGMLLPLGTSPTI